MKDETASRASLFSKLGEPIDEAELDRPGFLTVLKVVWQSVLSASKRDPGHLGNPLPELWSTLIWGLAAGATVYSIRSIWPVVLAHWWLNVFLDGVIAGII